MADRKEELVSGTGAEGTTAITPQGNRGESLRAREVHPGDMGAMLFTAGYRLDQNPYVIQYFNNVPEVCHRRLTDTYEDITLKHICLPIGAYLADDTNRDMEAPARVMGYEALADEQKAVMFEKLTELSIAESSALQAMSPTEIKQYEEKTVRKAQETLLGDLTPEGCALFDPEFVKEHGAEKCISFLGLLGVDAERLPSVIPPSLLEEVKTRARESIAAFHNSNRSYQEGEKGFDFHTYDPSMRCLFEQHPVLFERAVCGELFSAAEKNARGRDQTPVRQTIASYRDNGAFYRWSPGVQTLIEKYKIPGCSDEEMRNGSNKYQKGAFEEAIQKETNEVVSSVIRQNPESARVIRKYVEQGMFTDASSSTRVVQLINSSERTGAIPEVREMLIDMLRSTLIDTEKAVFEPNGSPPLDFQTYVTAQRGLHMIENPEDKSIETNTGAQRPFHEPTEKQSDGSLLIRTVRGEPLVSVPPQFMLTDRDSFGRPNIEFNTAKERENLQREIERAQNEKARLDEKIGNLTRSLDEAQSKAPQTLS